MATRRLDQDTIYAQRLDLDKKEVFLRGDGSNPMFFNIGGLPDYLSYGKHYFYISQLDSSNQEHQLQNNTSIVFSSVWLLRVSKSFLSRQTEPFPSIWKSKMPPISPSQRA